MINKDEILKLAELACLKLKPEEIIRIAKDESDILNYIDQINNLDFKEIVLSEDRRPVVLRSDQPKNFEFIDDLIEGFPLKEKNFLKIPPVFKK